jgi:hypothetical protein
MENDVDNEKIMLELCLSQSCGNRYSEPVVRERWTVESREEADRQIAEKRPNGFFVREVRKI